MNLLPYLKDFCLSTRDALFPAPDEHFIKLESLASCAFAFIRAGVLRITWESDLHRILFLESNNIFTPLCGCRV